MSFGGGSSGHEAGRGLANEFTRLTQVIGNNIQKITNNVAQMQRMVNQLGGKQDTPELRDKLHQVQHYTNQLSKDTSRYIHDLSQLPAADNQSEQRQRKMQRERLVNDFTTSLNNFQAAQRKAAEREKESVARARANSGLNYDPFLDEKKNENQLVVGIDSPSGIQVDAQAEKDADLQLLKEREQAIHQLEADITDVNQIFKDLGMLVHDQGEVIDSIQYNVDNTASSVNEGAKELKLARNYQSKARKKKFICILLIILILVIIAIIIGVSVGTKR